LLIAPQIRRAAQVLAPFIALAVLWQIAAFNFPSYLFPSLPDIARRTLEIFVDWPQFAQVLATVGRILAGLAGAFVLGGVLAVLMARSEALDRFFAPILNFFQGIPALSWVVFAIIWFHGIEFRIFFIMVVTSLPAFAFQVLDALRGMSKDLFEMVLAFRPTRRKLFRAMILPAILPDIMTAWKINLGNASRVVVVAELVGATGGVGYELLMQQQQFDMAGALAWTLQLVFFVLISQQVIALIEHYAFRYRAVSERAL
jgi:NitT/TauT family transport system permease protein